MVEVNKFKIGIFVFGGIVLALVVIFLLGGSKIFEKKVTVVTLFKESVQGLEVGSQVKFKGVSVGTVKDISILMGNNLIRVDMEIDPKAFVASKSKKVKFFDNSNEVTNSFVYFIREELKKGLGIRLEYAGITGFKYIEINRYEKNDGEQIEKPDDLDDDEIYLPSIPSLFTNISRDITIALKRLSKVHFEKIAANLDSGLDEVNKLVGDPALKETLMHIRNLSQKMDHTSNTLQEFTPKRFKKILELVEKNLKDYNNFAKLLNDKVAKVKVEQTIDAVRSAGYAIDNSSSDMEITLNKLNKLLDVLNSLVQSINEDPTMLLRGNNTPKIELK